MKSFKEYISERSESKEVLKYTGAINKNLTINWDKAPDWANYWAMDADGTSTWAQKTLRADDDNKVWISGTGRILQVLQKYLEFKPKKEKSVQGFLQMRKED